MLRRESSMNFHKETTRSQMNSLNESFFSIQDEWFKYQAILNNKLAPIRKLRKYVVLMEKLTATMETKSNTATNYYNELSMLDEDEESLEFYKKRLGTYERTLKSMLKINANFRSLLPQK